MRKFAVLLFVLMLVGCSSEFDRSMDLGKEALKEGSYVTAVQQFENALIENPSDEDATLLLEKAKEGLKKAIAADQFKSYTSEFKDLLLKYVETKDPVTEEEAKLKTHDDYVKLTNELEEIKENSQSIMYKYQNNTEIQAVHSIFEESLDEAITATKTLAVMVAMAEEKVEWDADKFEIYKNRMKIANNRSNELIFKYTDTVKEINAKYGF